MHDVLNKRIRLSMGRKAIKVTLASRHSDRVQGSDMWICGVNFAHKKVQKGGWVRMRLCGTDSQPTYLSPF